MAEWAAMVRQYARVYWRERLQAELHGVEGEPAEPRVVEVPIDRTLFPKRDPRAGRNQLDLTDFYTGELGETFHGKVGGSMDHDDDLSQLPVGLVELGGVEFDIRGVIQLRRTEPLGGAWELATLDDPVRVDGIPIQQEATRLHLLLGTVRAKEPSQAKEPSSAGWSCTTPTAKPGRWTSSMATMSSTGGMNRPRTIARSSIAPGSFGPARTRSLTNTAVDCGFT